MPTARRHHLLRRAATLVTVVALTAAGACGGGDDAPEDDARATTTVDPTTTIQLTPEEEAEAVYLEFVDTVYRLLTEGPDPDDPHLERLATEPVLGRTRDSLTTMQAENHIVEKGPSTSQQVLSSAGEVNTVTLRACSVGDDVIIDQDDESVVDEGLSAYLLEITVKSDGDQWKVSDIATVERFDGRLTCPE